MQSQLENFFTQNTWEKKIAFETSLRPYTSFQCNATAKVVIRISTKTELKRVLAFCLQQKTPYLILGKGSNSIFTDKGFDGVILLLDGEFKNIIFLENHQVLAGAGVSATGLSQQLKKKSLGGGEFLIAIPASIGGLAFMNAGANNYESKDIIQQIETIDCHGNIHTHKKDQLVFGYRYSNFMMQPSTKSEIITQVLFQFSPQKKEQIEQMQSEILSKRRQTQPIYASTWGSVFQNPPRYFAAELIEKCGFKGKNFGGLQISNKHSNFFENQNNATFQDIETAITQIQKKVWEQCKVFLKPEVRIFDEQGRIIEKFYQAITI